MASPIAIYLFSDPLLEHLEALTRIRLLVLRLLNIIKNLPTKEMGELTTILSKQVELRSLPKGALFKQPPPKKKHSKANQRGKTSAKIAKRAADVTLADEVDINIKEDKQQPFNEPSVLYNEVLRGLKDKVVILEAGKDDNLWLNNAESRHLSYSINLAERRVLKLEGPILN
ncbi:hypothetical protein V2W45_1463672 [Cenococcum geophilum]